MGSPRIGGQSFLLSRRRDIWHQFSVIFCVKLINYNNVFLILVGSFRFEDEDEDEDEALCFRHNEIFRLFRLQLGRDDEVDCKNVVTPSLSRI